MRPTGSALWLVGLILCSTHFPQIAGQRARNVAAKSPNCLGILSTLSTATEVEGKFTLELEYGSKIYEPFEKYSIILKSNDINTHFKEFNIIAVSEENNTRVSVGRFERYKETHTKHSDDCPNGVTQSSLLPKQEIKVKWIAPPSGSGCIRFKAAARNLEPWINSTTMTFVVCEESQLLDGQPKVLTRCTACDEAKYGIEITGLWSRNTHPTDYPKSPFDSSFSDFIGATHTNFFHIFTKDDFASEELREMAENGQSKSLVRLMNDRQVRNNIRTILKAKGITHPLLNGKTFAEFRVDRDHHLVSLVAKLIPSPDWFVGVDSLELCLKNGSWIDEKQMNLYLYDAGTDGGSGYQNANKLPLKFKERIYQITNLHPENSPFYNVNESKIKPFARIKVTKQRLFPTKQPCRLMEAIEEEDEPDDSLERNLVYGENDNLPPSPNRPLLRPTDRYGNRDNRYGMGRDRFSGGGVDNRFGNNRYGDGRPGDNRYGDNRYGGNQYGDNRYGEAPRPDENGEYIPTDLEREDFNNNPNPDVEVNSPDSVTQSACATNEYTEWSECELNPNNPSPNCGMGTSKRSRELLNPANAAMCDYVLLTDDKVCEIPCGSGSLSFQTGNRDGYYGRDSGRRGFNNRNRMKEDSFAIGKDTFVNRDKTYEKEDDSGIRPYDSTNSEENNENYDSPGDNNEGYDPNNENYGDTNDQYGGSENYQDPNEPYRTTSRGNQFDSEENYRIPENCQTTEWSQWSSCFGDCSIMRYKNRTRSLTTFESYCLGIPLVETRECPEECGGSGGFGRSGRQRSRLNPRNVTPRMAYRPSPIKRANPANRNANTRPNTRPNQRNVNTKQRERNAKSEVRWQPRDRDMRTNARTANRRTPMQTRSAESSVREKRDKVRVSQVDAKATS